MQNGLSRQNVDRPPTVMLTTMLTIKTSRIPPSVLTLLEVLVRLSDSDQPGKMSNVFGENPRNPLFCPNPLRRREETRLLYLLTHIKTTLLLPNVDFGKEHREYILMFQRKEIPLVTR